MSDSNFSPFPAPGKHFEFRRRKAIAVRAEPMYDTKYPSLTLNNLKKISVKDGDWFFMCWNFWNWHGYAGWRPITLDDPGFYWREHWSVLPYWVVGRLFVQHFAVRMGFGDIS